VVGLDITSLREVRKGHADAALLSQGFDHGLAFDHDFGQRHRFQRQREAAGFHHGQVEDLCLGFQQVAGFEMCQVVEPAPVELIDQIGGHQREHAGDHDDSRQRVERHRDARHDEHGGCGKRNHKFETGGH
jgi:hypothetical protein